MRKAGPLHLLPAVLVTALALLTPAAVAQTDQRLTWDDFIKRQSFDGLKRPTLPVTCLGLPTQPCVIPAGLKVSLRQSLNVRSLKVLGDLLVQPPPSFVRFRRPIQPPLNTILNTSFILVKGPQARLTINGTTWNSRITVFLRRDPSAWGDLPPAPSDEDSMLGGGRVLAAWQGAQVVLDGYPLKRTWTLLTNDSYPNTSSICVSDNVQGDWQIGSSIAIAPSDNVFNIWPTSLSKRIGPQTFKITRIEPAVSTPCCRPELLSSCSGSRISLSGNITKTPQTQPGQYPEVPAYHGSQPPVQAEVLLLDRTLLITGSNISARYKPSPPPPWKNPANPETGTWPEPWSQWANSSYPTEGLHVLAAGLCDDGSVNGKNCQSNGGYLKARYTRVEKAGQRGFIGRYPLHFHKMGDCPDCEFTGNAVVGSTQRGIVIHSTHRSKVIRNVVFGAKGAHLYVEEGTELENTIQENALVCDVGVASYTMFTNGSWKDAGLAPSPDDGGAGKVHGGGGCQDDARFDFGDPAVQLGGCRVQGTDNEQADCAQQAGIWSLSVSNNFIGNRVSNHYNGIYFQSTLFKDGRLGTDSLGRVCPLHSNWGVMRGNVVHTNQRFGWYPDVNYPNAVKRSVESNGYVTDLTAECTDDLTNFGTAAVCSCRPYSLPDGASNSQAVVTYEDGIDWGNGFVGQYDLADVQYKNFTSINNNIGMYWKGSKNFRTLGTSLIKDSVFQFNTRARYNSACCNCASCICPPKAPAYPLADWLAAGAAATSLLQLPGASATMILENVRLAGSPGVAEWLPPQPGVSDTWVPGDGPAIYPGPGKGVRNGGQGAALAINQQCKFFKGFVNPLGALGYDEGALCTPQVYLLNVTFDLLDCKAELGQEQSQLPVWVNIGAANGNSYLGMVVAADDSLCGGLMQPCPIRAVVSNYSTHLLDLPGNPCFVPSFTNTSAQFGPDWFRRFNGHMICKKQTRRLNIWGPDQGPLLLTPPGGARPWEMHWLGFGIPKIPCWGTNCSANEERRWAEGYGATVMSNEELPGAWNLTRMDGQPVDLSKVRMIEFSDQVFGTRFPADTLQLQIDRQPLCVLSSTDSREWMTQFGPVRRGGGSCKDLLSSTPDRTGGVV